MTDLTPTEIIVLNFASDYGPLVDFGGRGANRAQLNAVKVLIKRGLINGHYRGASITNDGRAALANTSGDRN